jgi:hypothetical protein
MTTEMEKYVKSITKYEEPWCKLMGFSNPYLDPFNSFISKNVPDFDYQAFNKYTNHNFVYDKLWVAKSQGLLCGTLSTLKQNKNICLPIFIKPRWGHKTATSKNCFKINQWDEITNYKQIPDMMWSEFIDAKEQMTDYVLLNGQIVYQITYIYSDSQNEFIDDWKYISPETKPIEKITDWVNRHLSQFTGAVNMQYRDDKIIEVGLRFARGGAYILSTKNKYLIENINNVVNNGIWDYNITQSQLDFEPFYSFKVYCSMPVIYIFPQYYLDYIIEKNSCMPFYEYYFEPSGKNGSVVVQFLHKNFEKGMETKKYLETAFTVAQWIFCLLFILSLYIFSINKTIGILCIICLGILFNTRFLNPISVSWSQWKSYKQMFTTT